MIFVINLFKCENIVYSVCSYVYDVYVVCYGGEVVEKFGLDLVQVFKILLVSIDIYELLVVIVLVVGQLDLKVLVEVVCCRKCEMVVVDVVQCVIGYLVGGISLLGQKKCLCIFFDFSVEFLYILYVSVGCCGLEVELVLGDLLQFIGGYFVVIGKVC